MGNLIEKCCDSEKDKEIARSSRKVPTLAGQGPVQGSNPKNDSQDPFEQKPTTENEHIISDTTITKILDKKAKIKKRIEFEDFQIDGKLGEGGFGVVYLGQLKSNIKNDIVEKYAIKKVSKELLMKKRVYANAIDEKNILAMYECKFIVTLVMAFQDPWHIYFVMEYASGGDTYSLIKKGSHKAPEYKALGETAVRFIAGCVVLGLEFLHKSNYMYRDLKPQNVLMFDNGYVKLTDFGLAKKELEGVTNKTVSGTQFYYAPEMLLKKGYGKQIDIWTFGVYLYELSVYEPPFTVEQITRPRFQAVCLEAENNRNWKNGNVSQPLKDLINSILKFDPSQRLGAKGWQEIKDHDFFKGFDWNALEKMEMESPLKDLINKYPVTLKPYRPEPVKKNSEEQSNVEGFTFVKNQR